MGVTRFRCRWRPAPMYHASPLTPSPRRAPYLHVSRYCLRHAIIAMDRIYQFAALAGFLAVGRVGRHRQPVPEE